MADAQINNFVSRTRALADDLIDTYNLMVGIRDEYAKLGYSATIIQAELDGANLDVTGTEIVAVMTSIDNLKSYMDAGNATNLYRVIP